MVLVQSQLDIRENGTVNSYLSLNSFSLPLSVTSSTLTALSSVTATTCLLSGETANLMTFAEAVAVSGSSLRFLPGGPSEAASI
jgi:hypothetical protein